MFLLFRDRYPILDGYPAGMGMNFHLKHVAGTGMAGIFGYDVGRVNILLAPYPTRCHRVSRIVSSEEQTGSRENTRAKNSGGFCAAKQLRHFLVYLYL